MTLTNDGYLDYTINCALSLRNIGFDGSLVIYAIGQKAYRVLKQRGFESKLIDDEENTEFQEFRRGSWANVTYYKFDIIHENLKHYDFVCFTDGDIIFEDGRFLQYCLSHIGENDLLIQNDGCKDDNDNNLCSGFMLVRSNRKTKELFNPDKMKSEIKVGWDDQVYINQLQSALKIEILPLSLFPNGQYYLKNSKSLAPYIIHFNWSVGHDKAYNIIKFRKWQSTRLLIKFIYTLVVRTIRRKKY